MSPLRLDRTGTAAIEFALVAPIMALLIIGLADTVRRNLAMIDVGAAAHAGALTAQRLGLDPERIAAAVAAHDDAITAEITPTVCAAKGNGNTYVVGHLHVDCGTFPAGRYVAIVTRRDLPSLFGADRDPVITATALVRLP